MKLYFAGCFESLNESRRNQLYLPLTNRLLSFYFIKDIPNELYLQKGEIYEHKQKGNVGKSKKSNTGS